ncbi:ANTAR domain-containing protein [Actinomycetospora sp. NBC_00405]|uniref:ANTAR domain-containing protein n=1 Tax=Actinomycetospora sp. NBC_00405 TaxID=2975952 RepID=UPI002E1F6173
MADHELNPRDWRDIQVLRAQGVLAEVLVVDLDEADQGLRAYADATGTPLHDVARQVCDRDLAIDRELCVVARDRANQAELLARSENALELARKTLLRLADTAEALAHTYDRIADRRETDARNAGCTDPHERARITRRRADAERRDAQRLRRAAEPPPETR